MLRGLVFFVCFVYWEPGFASRQRFSLLRQALASRLVQTNAWIPLTASSTFLVCRRLLLCLAPERGREETEWPPARWRSRGGIRASRLCKASQPETQISSFSPLSSAPRMEERNPEPLHQAVLGPWREMGRQTDRQTDPLARSACSGSGKLAAVCWASPTIMMNCTGQEPKNVNDQHLNHGTTGWLGLQGTFRDHHITCPHPQLPRAGASFTGSGCSKPPGRGCRGAGLGCAWLCPRFLVGIEIYGPASRLFLFHI